MKIVSLVGVFREKAVPAERLVPIEAADTPPKTKTSPIEAAAMAPSAVATAPEGATSTTAETAAATAESRLRQRSPCT